MSHPVVTTPMPPPDGHDSWLEYALTTLDVRSLLNRAALDGDRPVQREEVLAAAWAELNALRARAGLPAVGPTHHQDQADVKTQT